MMNKIIKSAIFISLMVFVVGINSGECVQAQWMDATHLFDNEVKTLAAKVNLETKEEFATRTKTPTPQKKIYKVGDVETFWAKNIQANKFEQIPATLKAIGTHCYIFLQNGKTVSDQAIENIRKSFDETIYSTNTQTFGSEWKPGVDGDERITLFMFDIQDGYNGDGGFVAGFFFAGDEFLQSQIPADIDVKSNEREMFYLDINPADPEKNHYMSVVAHEFQHMIHFNHDKKELTWVNEACSQIAPYLCGFGHANQIMSFVELPDNSMTAWAKEQILANYGQVYLWNYYLLNRYLKDKKSVQAFFSKLVDDKSQGIAGYDRALKQFNTNFSKSFTEFAVTNFVNNPKLDKGQYAYDQTLGRLKLPAVNFIKTLPGNMQDKVFPWSADGVKIDLSSAKNNLKVEFEGQLTPLGSGKNTNFIVAAVLLDSREQNLPQIQYLRMSESSSKKAQVANTEIVKTVQHDTLMIVVSLQAPTTLPENSYAKTPGVPYSIKVSDSGQTVVLNRSNPVNTRSILSNYVETSRNVANSNEKISEQALTTLDGITFDVTKAVRTQLENNSTAAIDELLDLGQSETNRAELRPLAKKVAEQLVSWKLQSGNVATLDQKIESLKSF